MKEYYVDIMASKRNGALYTGVTSDLVKRGVRGFSGTTI